MQKTKTCINRTMTVCGTRVEGGVETGARHAVYSPQYGWNWFSKLNYFFENGILDSYDWGNLFNTGSNSSSFWAVIMIYLLWTRWRDGALNQFQLISSSSTPTAPLLTLFYLILFPSFLWHLSSDHKISMVFLRIENTLWIERRTVTTEIGRVTSRIGDIVPQICPLENFNEQRFPLK